MENIGKSTWEGGQGFTGVDNAVGISNGNFGVVIVGSFVLGVFSFLPEHC